FVCVYVLFFLYVCACLCVCAFLFLCVCVCWYVCEKRPLRAITKILLMYEWCVSIKVSPSSNKQTKQTRQHSTCQYSPCNAVCYLAPLPNQAPGLSSSMFALAKLN